MRPIRSFDVFDTLIARRCIDATGVHEIVEERSRIAGLAAARLHADDALHAMGPGYDLRCIYVLACRLIGQPAHRADDLAALEYAVELENVIPVTENIEHVRGDDLIISDMYPSEPQIRGLLARAGAPLRNVLIVSNHGKAKGHLWAALRGRLPITEHFGDNAHSDVAMPRLAGIKGVLVQQHVPTPAERRCLDAGLHELAQVMRVVRLASARTGEADILWRSACQLNFPLLVMASQALEATCVRTRLRRLVFFARDGNQWIDVHRTLYPDRESRYLYCSRETFLVPSSEFDAYFDEQSGEAALYVDLFSTGSSFSTYLAARRRQGQLFVICKADDMSYRSNAAGDRDHLAMHPVFLRSSLPQSGRLGLGLEMANFALHRRTRGVLRVPGGHLPVFADEREYDERKVAILGAGIQSCLGVLDMPRCLDELAKVDTVDLMTAIYTELNGDQALWRCFPEHHAADVRYLASLSSTVAVAP